MNDLISVIVPIYNVEAYLDECLDSICNQTYKNIEILLIDDGSTDNSGVIADEWVKKDNRCTVYHKENEGLSAARNDGIKVAKGTYLIFVDSDDLIKKNMIKRLYSEAIRENVDIVCCGYEKRYGEIDKENIYHLNDKKMTFEEFFETMYLYQTNKKEANIRLAFVVAWNKIYKSTLFKDILYPNGRVNEDEAIIHKLVCASGSVKWINESLYIYRNRENSIMNSGFSYKSMDGYYALKDRVKFFENKLSNKILYRAVVADCLDLGRRVWCIKKSQSKWEQEKESFNDIKECYGKYVDEDTFILKKKLVWKLFLSFPNAFASIWRVVFKVKKYLKGWEV